MPDSPRTVPIPGKWYAVCSIDWWVSNRESRIHRVRYFEAEKSRARLPSATNTQFTVCRFSQWSCDLDAIDDLPNFVEMRDGLLGNLLEIITRQSSVEDQDTRLEIPRQPAQGRVTRGRKPILNPGFDLIDE